MAVAPLKNLGYIVAAGGNLFGMEKLLVRVEASGGPLMTLWDSARRSAETPYSHPWLAETIFALDAKLRRRHGVLEYSCHPSCVFRIQIARARRLLTLADGTRLEPGQRIARLHFWNEHIPPVPQHGTTILWARQLQKSISISLRELAHYLSSRPDLNDVFVICGDVPSATRAQWQQIEYIMAYYGFETVMRSERLPLGERIHRFGENVLISLIVFARNAAALRLDTLSRVRVPIYLSRRTLERKFGRIDKTAPEAVEVP
ncbi:MAG: YkoP family protein [Xanthobacteraceae bacterium]